MIGRNEAPWRGWRNSLAVAGLALAVWAFATAGAQAAVIYTMTGACLVGCDSIGATNGDPASAVVSGGFTNLNLGSDTGLGDPNIVNTNDPFTEPNGLNKTNGYEFTGTSDGSTLSALQIIVGGANLFSFNAGSWLLSLSTGLVFPTGSGAFTRRAAPEDGAFIYDFAGTCDTDCAQVGLTNGDPVSGEVSLGSVALTIGATGDALDTMDPAADGINLSGVSDGTAFSELRIDDDANVFVMPSVGNDWLLSPSFAACIPECMEQEFAEGDWEVESSEGGVVAIPEPGALALLGIGLLGLGVLRRRPRHGA